MLADLGAPVAALAKYCTIGFAVITLVAGWVWFGKRQRALRAALSDGKITQEELAHATESNGWSITFAFGLVATLILSLALVAQLLMPKPEDGGPDRGVLATMMPALQKMQDSLFNIQKDVTEIKSVTGETKAQTERIEQKTAQVITKLDEMSRAFEEASKQGGMIAGPKTPAEHYHNPRFAEVKADFAAARKSYNAFLATGVEFMDPYLAWTDMLKVQEGLDGAREVIASMRKTNTTLSLAAAEALLLPKAARTGASKKLLERAPEFSPAVYLLSGEFSAEKLGEQTVADKREEKAALESFRALNEKGQFQKYDTGAGSVLHPQTGLPIPIPTVNAENLAAGDHTVEVRYTDVTGKVNGPWQLRFNTAAAALAAAKQALNQIAPTWVSFRDYDGKTLLYFTAILPYRGSLKAIRYSLDGETLDKTWPIKPPAPGEAPYSPGEGLPFIVVPGTTKSACVQLEYADGAQSEKKVFARP